MATAAFFILGMAGLFFGGDWLVKGASGMAARFRVPPLVIGLTVVGFGTSAPELLVSIEAAMRGAPGIAIGNVLGSNIANILLIIGLSATIGALAAPFERLSRDLAWMLAAALLTVPVFWSGFVGRVEGAFLVAGIAAYILVNLRQAGTVPPSGAEPPPLARSLVRTAAGLAGVLIGARLLVDSATEIARTFGVSEAVIGLTIVAIGTSLPEMATSVAAAFRGHREIALGNAIGSNVFNILAILGITALVVPIPVDPRFLAVDVPLMIGVSLLLAFVVWRWHGLSRGVGIGFLAAYAAYVAAMAVF